MRIARVFPRKTIATPDDELVFFAEPPGLFLHDIDEVHVSVALSYDMKKAEQLAYQWEALGVPVKLSGPAFNVPGGDFIPGRYLKPRYVITSRGCPNRCWFCAVPAREGALRELPITEGYNVLDDNLLACSEGHIRAVFAMLARQRRRPLFTGGLEAKLLRPWHVDLLREHRARQIYCAYDTTDDYEPLVQSGRLLRNGGISAASHVACCYVLIGYRGDTFDRAERRLRQTIDAGFMPFAMLYRDITGTADKAWTAFQREWARKEIVGMAMKNTLSTGAQ